jgi:hypothetical protein
LRRRRCALLLAFVVAVAPVGCRGSRPETAGTPAAAGLETAADKPAVSPPRPTVHCGTVVETMDSGGYTYLRIDEEPAKVWLAAPQMAVKVGDRVEAPPGMRMKDFESRTLRRVFEEIFFVGRVKVLGQEGKAAEPASGKAAGDRTAVAPPPSMHFSGLTRPEGGLTVGEIFAKRSELGGREVLIRGKVVKFTPDVMGKNWLHVQDGTAADEFSDVTVTTDTDARVGDTVLVRGIVALDRDLGFGYRFAVLLENATVTVEK